MRQAIGILCLIAAVFGGINFVISRGSLDPVAVGFTLLFGIIVVPFALIIALVLDRRFLRTKRDPPANDAKSRFGINFLAPLGYAAMAIAPFILWRRHVISANSWWLISSPMWAGVLVYRLITSAPETWFRSSDRNPH